MGSERGAMSETKLQRQAERQTKTKIDKLQYSRTRMLAKDAQAKRELRSKRWQAWRRCVQATQPAAARTVAAYLAGL